MAYKEVDYDYIYPKNLDIKPGSELHEKILGKIMKQVKDSSSVIESRFDSWREIDHTLTTYIDLDEYEKKLQQKDSRKPVTIVVPVSYATLETLLTYRVAAFLESPIFKYEGWGPEDVKGAILLERVIELQVRRFKTALSLYTMWRDDFVYGLGVVACDWEQIKGYKSVNSDNGFMTSLGRLFGRNGRQQKEFTTLFEGNVLYNVDPYNYLPDPNNTVMWPQRASFHGWVDRTNYYSLLEEETNNSESGLFNIRYLDQIPRRTSKYFVSDASGRETKTGYPTAGSVQAEKTAVDIIYMYCRIIPSEWELGSSDKPEKWLFAVAADKVIIAAQPLGLYHEQFPIAISATSSDGHTPLPVSAMETIYGLQKTIDWLFRSHIANVRKAINDMIIVDPYMVNYDDVKNPEPGKLIRMRRAAWGRGVKDAIMQLNVTDVTRQNIPDIMFAMNMVEQVSGAAEAVKGLRRKTSERVSATEANQTFSSALSRLEKDAKLCGTQAMFDIADLFAAQTKQLMTTETFVKSVGRMGEDLSREFGGQYANVKPSDIDVFYDVVPHDGTVPGNNDGIAWTQLFQILATNPVIAQEFDIVRVFKHIARALGAKNVNDFVQKGGSINSQLAEPDQIDRGVQRGNLIPIDQLSMS
jgi:hypothetical protein